MTQTEPEPEAAPTALDLRPDGRIVIAFVDDSEVMLRRPTLGQFRRWRVMLNEIGEDSTRLIQQARIDAEADKENEELDEVEKLQRRGTRALAIQDASEVAAEKWWGDVFDSLAEGEVPPVDDWPPFLVFGDSILADVLSHWRSVPSAPGARSNKAK